MLTFFFPTEKERTYFFGAADVVCGFIPRPIHINTSMITICFIFLFMCFPPLRCPAPFCYRLILAYFPVPVYTVSHVTKIVTPSSCCFFFSETLSVFILLFLWFFPQDVSDFQSRFYIQNLTKLNHLSKKPGFHRAYLLCLKQIISKFPATIYFSFLHILLL